jgi:hypothetical protein
MEAHVAVVSDVASRVAKIFVSYKRNVDPDQALAGRVVAELTAAGHSVFYDQRLKVGEEWAREIETQVRASDYLVVLLTAASSASEMVRGEVEIARKAAQEGSGSPKILPVRVAFSDALPYPLSAYLDSIQYAFWSGSTDTDPVIAALRAAIAGTPVASSALPVSASDGGDKAPPYAAMLPPPGGTIDVDDPFYVERGVDVSASRLAVSPGQTLIIKGPRQMGKSSLMMRVVAKAVDAGKRAALIDLQLLDKDSRSSVEKFFKWFCVSIAEQLQLEGDPLADWDPESGVKQNCTSFIEKRVLRAVREPVMLAVDESDIAFKVPSGTDFFTMLRNWHGRRANPIVKTWKRVDLVLVTAVDPDRFIDDPHESPFNVGVMHLMEDLSFAQVEALNRRHPQPLARNDLEVLFRLVGGHPFLIRKALYLTAGPPPRVTMPDLVKEASDDMGPFGDHLRYYMLRLAAKPEVLQGLREGVMHGTVTNDLIGYRLQGSGLLRRVGERLVPRCDLYNTYFRAKLHIDD